MTLRRAIYGLLGLIAAATLVLFIYVKTGRPERRLAAELVEAAEKALGRPVTVTRVSLQYLPPGVAVEGFRAEGPLMSAERVEASISLGDLLGGRIVIQDVELIKPQIEWDFDKEPFLPERPPPSEEGALASRLFLRSLRVRGGKVVIGSETRALTADVEGLTLLGDNDSAAPGREGLKGPWEGSFSFTRGRFAYGDLGVAGAEGTVSFEADPNAVHVRRLRIAAREVDLRGDGQLTSGTPPRGRFDLRLTADPDSPSLVRPLHQFGARHLEADFTLTLTGEGVRIGGSFEADAPAVDTDRVAGSDGPAPPWNASRATGTFDVRAGRIEVAGSIEDFAGGKVDGLYVGLRDAEDPLAARRHQITCTGEGLSLETILSHFDLPGEEAAAPSARVDGRAEMRWLGGGIHEARGTAALTLRQSPGALPVTGTAALDWVGRRVTVRSSQLESPGSRIVLTGSIDATPAAPGDMRLDLSGTLSAGDVRPLAAFVESRFPASRSAPLRPGDLEGGLEGRFDLDGTAARPVAHAVFSSSSLALSMPPLAGGTGDDPSRLPLSLSRVDGEVSWSPDLLRVDLPRVAGERLSLSASVRMRPATGEVLGADLEAAEVPVALLAHLAGLGPAASSIAGTARATARLSPMPAEERVRRGPAALRGPMTLEADTLTVGDIALTDVRTSALLEGDRLHLEESTFRLYGGTARGRGDLTLGKGGARGTIEVSAAGIDLAAIDQAHPGPSLAGRAEADGRIMLGTPIGVEGRIAGQGVRIAGIDLGTVTGGVRGALPMGEGVLSFELKDETGGVAASGRLAQEGTAGERQIWLDARMQARKFNLEELRPVLGPGALEGLRGDADGDIVVRGPLMQAGRLEMRADFDRVNLVAGDYPLHNEGPVRVTLMDGFLTLANTRLVGEKTDLTLGGSMVAGGSYDVTARVEGTFDLGLIEILFPESRASGPGSADLRIIQQGDTLTYGGTVTLSGGMLRHPSLPQPLVGLTGVGRFDKDGLFRFEGLRFDTGGGHVIGDGWARFEGASMPAMHLALRGSGIRAELLPDLRAFFDADVTIGKEAGEYRFEGRIAIQRAIYTRAFGVEPTEVLLRSREYAPAAERRGDRPPVRLDLDIVAEGDLWVRNEDALIEAAAHLRLEGTLDEPELSGRISALEGGYYRFRDVTYRIMGGSLDFVDLTRIDPLLDIEAATRVQQYEVTLRISGRFSRPLYELTSDPPLDQRDIVWLLITGRPLTETPGDTTRAMGESQVAAYLAAPVAGAVTAPLERILGVSSVQIDPYFLNGTADPSARVTVTKRVASNLLFTASSSLGQSGQEIYQVEYNPARLWDVIGTRDIDGSVGMDFRFRRRWLGWNPLSRDMSAGQDGARQGQGAAPAEQRVGEITVVADHFIDKPRILVRLLPFDEGDPLRRGDLLEGRELLRQHYVERGHPAAEVDVIEGDPDPADPGRREVRYVVRAGPRHELNVEGEARRRPIEKAVEEAWREPILLEDLVEEARNAALGFLRKKGFHTASVAAGMETPEPGLRVVNIQVAPGPKVKVRSIAITGNEAMPEERIRKQMLTREAGFLVLFGSGLLREPVLAEDLGAIRALYLASGFLDVRISQPAIELTPDGKQADITIAIQEGPLWKVGGVSIEGDAPPGAEPRELLEAADLSPGQTISLQSIELAADRIRESLDKEGYTRARVAYRLDGTPGATRVVYTINRVERARIDRVIVEGNTRTRGRIVEREITLGPGDWLSRSAILTTQRNLYRLGVFRSVQIDTEPSPGKEGFVNVKVTLQEGAPLLTAWGAGYDSEDKIRGSFEIGNNNLFGTRRSAALFVKASSRDRRVQLTLRDPNFFGERIESLWGGFIERQEFESFDLRRVGATAQLSRKLRPTVTVFGRYRLEDIDLFNLRISEEETGQQTVRLGSIAASAAWDTRDDIIDPARGGLSSLDLRVYHPGLASEAQFSRIFASTSRFVDIGRGVVWATALRAGALTSDNIPVSERFFAGGDTTLRGFEFNQAGPVEQVQDVDPNDLDDPPVEAFRPTGGEGLFLFNQELRFPIWKAMKGVVFYDVGNVFADLGDYDLGELRHVAGVGLRFQTPVGPFRIEYGHKLDHELIEVVDDHNPVPDPNTGITPPVIKKVIRKPESRGEFFFSIGHAF